MRLFLFGKTECYSHWRWTKEYCMIWDMFWPLSSFKIPPKAPWGSPIVPYGRPIVPWEFEMKHFTIGWFHFGKTGCYLHGKWTKDYLMIWGMFWPFSGSEGSPRVPESLKWFTINDVVCPENLRLNILLWDEFTMEQGRIHGSISHARWAGSLMEVRALCRYEKWGISNEIHYGVQCMTIWIDLLKRPSRFREFWSVF